MNMGYPSIDSMINEMTVNGKRLRRETSKLTSPVHTAGGWHLLTGLGGYPNAGTFPGTDLLWANCDENSGDGSVIIGSQHGGPPGGSATKHVLNSGGMVVAAAGAPWFLRLVDLMGYYRLSTTNVTGTGSRALINSNTFTATAATPTVITYANDFKTLTKVRFTTSNTLPAGLSTNTDYWLVRLTATTANVASSYANALAGTFVACSNTGTGTHTLTIQMRNPVGCEAFFAVQTAPTAGGPNLTASSYTNSQGVAGRAFQGSPSMGAAADAYATRVLNSGNAAGRYGAFMPKQGADVGINSIESFTLSGGTAYTGSGVLALCVAKPLDVDIPLPVSGMFTWMDLVHMCPSLPKVDDGACLQWMLFGAGATTNLSPIMTLTDFGWAG
jgi:hypothetical protein